MALSKQRRPLVLMAGTVIALEAKAEYDDNSKKTGNVARYDVTIIQANHATPDLRFPLTDGLRIPNDGEQIAVVVDCGETREYGANFRVVRYATDEDLDEFARFIPALASK